MWVCYFTCCKQNQEIIIKDWWGARLMEAPPPPPQIAGIALSDVKIRATKYLFICRRQDRNQSYTECENLLQGIHKANNISAQTNNNNIDYTNNKLIIT